MVCSLNCFCDFFEAETSARRTAVVKKYKKTTTGPSKGRMNYYTPALRLMRGTLCPQGSLEEKFIALRDACISPKWTDKLNDAKVAANTRVYNAFRSEFGDKKLRIFSSPRLQFLASSEVAVNLQPELYAEVNGMLMVWKFGLCKDSRPEHVIRAILQILSRACRHKGLQVPIDHMRFLDTMTGTIYQEAAVDVSIENELDVAAKKLAEVWQAT